MHEGKRHHSWAENQNAGQVEFIEFVRLTLSHPEALPWRVKVAAFGRSRREKVKLFELKIKV